MDRGSRRWVLRLGVVLVAGAAMLIWALRQQAQSMLTIVNQSGQTIEELSVTVGKRTASYPWQIHLIGHAATAQAAAPLGAPMAPVLQIAVAAEVARAHPSGPAPYRNIAPGDKVTVPFVTSPTEHIIIRARLHGGTWGNYLGLAGDYLMFDVLPDGSIKPQTGNRK